MWVPLHFYRTAHSRTSWLCASMAFSTQTSPQYTYSPLYPGTCSQHCGLSFYQGAASWAPSASAWPPAQPWEQTEWLLGTTQAGSEVSIRPPGEPAMLTGSGLNCRCSAASGPICGAEAQPRPGRPLLENTSLGLTSRGHVCSESHG